MRKDNPFLENSLSKMAPLELLEKTEGLERPLERAMWALETPFLLPQSYMDSEPEGLFASILAGEPLIDIPHCEALVWFFKDDFKKAKAILEAAPSDPYTLYNLVLCLEALGERDQPIKFWKKKLQEDLEWINRLAIYEHLRTNYALHEIVLEDLKTRFTSAEPDVMLKLLSHLALHKDFELADQLWINGAIQYEELEEYGVDLSLAQGKLGLAISRLKNLSNPGEKANYVQDFIKVVALKSIEEADFPAALEMTETLLDEFYDDLTNEDKLFYLRLKCTCSFEVLKNEIDVDKLKEESRQNLKQALLEIKAVLQRETSEIKALAKTLKKAVNGSEDEYLSLLDEMIGSLN